MTYDLRTQNVNAAIVARKRGKRVCLVADVEGMLSWSNKQLAGAMRHDDGREMTGAEVRDRLRLARHLGWKKLPVGSPCEGFSYETGCPGHA